MVIKVLKQVGVRLLNYERCAHKLSLSCCVGIYIAFSPFVGFHTAMVFLFSWLFALNFAVILSVSMFVNNPWTMVPVYGAGHLFGDWVLSVCGVNHYDWNPTWIKLCNEWLTSKVGLSGFSFWAFMIGGNILGVSLSIACYPVIKRCMSRLATTSKKKVLRSVVVSKRAVISMAAKAKPVFQRVVLKRFDSTGQKVTREKHENRSAK